MIGPLPIHYGLAAGPPRSGEAWIIEANDGGEAIYWADWHTEADEVVWTLNVHQAAAFASFDDAMLAYRCRGATEGYERVRAVCIEMA